jgi:hypothetical protein
VLFQDDFSSLGSGWTRSSLAEGSVDYYDGVYRIRVTTANADVWGRPGLNLRDVRMEVDALRTGGASDNRFGLMCRFNGEHNFYVFLISSDGYYGIGKVQGNSYTLLGAEAMLPSDKIHQGSDPNRIGVECIGEVLALYVNGELLAVTSDGSFTQGDIGLIAGVYGAGQTEIFFDNFLAVQP